MSGPISTYTRRWGLPLAGSIPSVTPLRLGYVEAMFNSLATAITAPLVIPLAASMGASDWQIGILTALPLLGLNLSQVPAARLGTASRRPWAYYAVAGGLGRLAWLVLALSLLLGRPNYLMLLSVATLASVSSGLQAPLWTAYLGARVDEDQRGRYFGTRNLLAGACGLAGAFAAAALVGLSGFAWGNGWALLLAVVASGSAVATMVWASRAFPWAGTGEERSAQQKSVQRERAVLASPLVRHYVLYGALLILGAGMATPFYSVHFINDLGGSPQVATMVMAVANASVMLAQGLWGRVLDRTGVRVIGGGSLFAIAVVPLLWMVAAVPELGIAAWLLNGVAWAACGLATFNLMLAISNDSNRSSVVAWVNTLQSPVNFAAPLLGGLIASKAGMQPLFAIASVVLVSSLLYFLRTVPSSKRD